ncbi:MAG: GYD domain-containing protein [Thermodesulfobacteriota bacterium]|nr:GYD domain-containing protein [Thermodesulfobacteriota bacterium]MEE2975328.1 GYD domain-containing protein [Thermodesulfobacteriota bacterium]|tara:strand:+ start:779 stop:1069 length:291 start_codon:yes stop_codon:yes gene_type:complete
MPKYIMLSNLTDEGRKTVKMRPERIKEVNNEIEKMGAKVLEQYAVLGEYDFINILEAPNNETISKISIELGSRGTIQFITLAAMPIDELETTLASK